MLPWPDRIDAPLGEFLPTVGRVVRRFGHRVDSRTTIVGIETDAGRLIVKHAADKESVGWLESAIRFHTVVSHPSIPPVVHVIATPEGLAIVERWASGEVLADGYDPSVPDRDDPRSSYQRFLSLPISEIAEAVQQLFHAHVAVTRAGFVAVDLYDGCLLYDFDRHDLSLIDLDMYCPGPYVLDCDRQLGSSAFMAPEEWRRGATIDERTTIFTLGRLALVLLGCDRDGQPDRARFRGNDLLFDTAMRACRAEPTERLRSVAELWRSWIAGTRANLLP